MDRSRDERGGYQPYSFPSIGSGLISPQYAAHPAPRPPPPVQPPQQGHNAASLDASISPPHYHYPPYLAPAIGAVGSFLPAGVQSRSSSLGVGNLSAASSSSGGPGNASSTDQYSTGTGAPSSKRARSGSSSAGGAPAGATPKGLSDKACKSCRVRKVKCDRQWPKCQRCKDRGDECNFGSMVPVDIIPDLPGIGPNSRVTELEGEVVTLKLRLAEAQRLQQEAASRAASMTATPKPNPLLAESIRTSFLSGTRHSSSVQVDQFLTSIARHPLAWGGSISSNLSLGESSLEWKLARSHLATALTLHLVHSFFSSCCSFLPIFDPWHSRLPEICEHIDHLDPANQVAVTAFCAMGARASPHSALLGTHDLGPTDPNAPLTSVSAMAAGVRREQACRSLHQRAVDLTFDMDEILHDPSPVTFEALMVEVQMLAFAEFVPRKARTLIRLAFGQFQDLQNSQEIPDQVKQELSRSYSLPLFTCDAITSAYARKMPIITLADCRQYLRGTSIPDFSTESLDDKVNQHIPENTPKGTLTHELLVSASHEVHAWLGQAQRAFAELVARPPSASATQFSNEVYHLWSVLDQAHQASQALQTTLINLDHTPVDCGADGCNDLHLRFITRLDRDTMDVTFLLHSLVKERQLDGPLGASLYLQSEKRVRNALKLVAFYSELYITSRDPHMSYHLFWQLELLPNWTEMVLQRHGETGGPATEALEVTEIELEWFGKGLACASYYHPVATGRLKQMEQNRRAERLAAPSALATSIIAAASGNQTNRPSFTPAPLPSHQILDHPPQAHVYAHQPTYSSPYVAVSSGLVGAAQASGTAIVVPPQAAGGAQGGPWNRGGDMQEGVTDARAAKSWGTGDWSGHHLTAWAGSGV